MTGARNVSYWVASTPQTEYPALDGDREADVAVLGGGIVGLTAALLLRRHGLEVVLLEQDRICHGTTGYTTAKLTAGHGVIYRSLERKHGADAARLYAEANEEGIEFVARLVEKEGVDCDFERRPNYVYAEDPSNAPQIEEEVDACRRAGLAADIVKETGLPFRVAAASRLPNEAQFHPRKYALEVARRFAEEGGTILEGTRATGVGEGGVVKTPTGRLRAKHVVVATHYPFVDRALLFARVHPKRSYCIAGPIPGEVPHGMYISTDQPTRSVRPIRDGERTVLLVGGEGHGVGQDRSTEEHYENLERWAAERFGMTDVQYRWSAQDGVPVDQLPYIGPYRPRSSVYVVTGFQKWGMAMGTTAARMIRDRIVGAENPYARLFDPTRVAPRASIGKLARENAKVGRYWIGDRVLHTQRRSADSLEPGEAGIDRHGLRPVACYRDDAGRLHRVSAVCTHLRCLVAWNPAERTWDCPCHGSRFDPDGRVIEGPAVEDLERLDESPRESRPK